MLMSIVVEWFNGDEATILWQFGTAWSWEDYYEAARLTHLACADFGFPVALIFDYSATVSPPTFTLGNLVRGALRLPEQVGATVMVCSEHVPAALLERLTSTFTERNFFAASLAEAAWLIRQERHQHSQPDETLPLPRSASPLHTSARPPHED